MRCLAPFPALQNSLHVLEVTMRDGNMLTSSRLPFLSLVLEVTMRDGNEVDKLIKASRVENRFRSDYEGWKPQKKRLQQSIFSYPVLEVTMRDGNRVL